MTGIWLRLVSKNKIIRDVTVPCDREGWAEALEEGVHTLDVPRPMVLKKHERDFEEFGQMRFLKEHFIEDVSFDRMEMEWIDTEKTKPVLEEAL